MKTKDMKTSLWQALLVALMLLTGQQAWAWDSEPDPETGKYDELFDRPTFFPDWSQPHDWPNNMAIRCQVYVGDRVLSNYEVAVYDQNDRLRHCNRSIASQGDRTVLTVMGTEGDTFHFKVVYGDDFQNPVIADVPDITVDFKTNGIIGLDEPFQLVIPGRIILTEENTSAIVAKEGVDVTVERTITGGEWGTICLPLAIAADQMDKAFGEGWLLGDFTGCDVTYEADDVTVSSIDVNFKEATSLEANHPYIIKVREDITSIDIDGVDIVALEEDALPSVDCDPFEYQVQTGKNKFETRYDYNSFIGNYTNGFLIPEQCLFLSGGKFWYSAGKTPLMAFRAYFDFYDVLPEAMTNESGVRITIYFDADETTDVKDGKWNDSEKVSAAVWYTLDGRMLSGKPVQKGVYVVDGRKVVIP